MIAAADAKGFDFHCHVDLARDPVALIKRCEAECIVTLAVTTTPKAWSQNRDWMDGSRFVIPLLGLHPELVAERHGEITLLESLMPNARFIGEIGLDGSPKYRKGLDLQKEIFCRILRGASTLGGRVCTIHSRWAVPDVLDALALCARPGRVLPILHWFGGTAAQVARATALGCWFSVNGQMLQREANQRMVRAIPLDRLLTETDSPFSNEGERVSVPWDVMRTQVALARLYDVSSEEMERTLMRNSARVLAFGGAVGPETVLRRGGRD